jgi:predicted ABC-type ATPase
MPVPTKAQIEAIAKKVKLTGWAMLTSEFEPYIQNIAAETGSEVLMTLGIQTDATNREIVNVASEWARERSAELVGKKWVDGVLVDNPNPVWSIKETTREALNGIIAEAMEKGPSVQELAPLIEELTTESSIFSPYRADMIARTEIGMAHMAGSKAGYEEGKALGLEFEKKWLVSQDEPDDECMDNADEDWIPYDDAFSSGDDMPLAHPNCKCSLAVRVIREGQEEETDDGEAEKLAKGGSGSGNFGHSGREGQVGGSGEGGSSKVSPPTGANDMERFFSEVEQTPEYKEVDRKLSELQKETRSGNVTTWSIDQNSDAEGNLTAERMQLHEEIINSMLNDKAAVPEGQRPQAVLLIGASGAGKSTAGLPYAKEIAPEHTYVNSDDVKEALPGYQGWNAAAFHGESGKLAEGELAGRALGLNHNIVMDLTGRHASKMERMASEFAKRGYDVHTVFVDIPSYVSTGRVWSRFSDGTGRFVPPRYAYYGVDTKPLESFERLKTNPDVKSYIRIDNTNRPAVVVDRGGKH